MPLTDNAKNGMLDSFGTRAATVSLHSADPGTTGANELTGGTPAYARQAVTWNAAAAGNLDSSNAPVFDVPAVTISHYGMWSGDATPVFLGGGALSAAETYAAQGTYTLSDLDVNLTDV